MFIKSEEGVPQGGPISPLLANVMLNELDQKLEEWGYRFVRYADDLMIFTKSKRAAERQYKRVSKFIEGKLKLKINKEKTRISKVNEVKYLGYAFYRVKGKCRFRVHPWVRRRIRMITWKRWKKVKTRFENLQKLGVAKEQAWQWANTRKSYWHIANSHILATTLTNARFEQQGYLSFLKYYLDVRV